MPLMLYFEWLHKSQTGLLGSTFMEIVLDRNVGFTPIWFGALGYHLWFLGFLFSFSILGLPICLWLKGDRGQRFTCWLARMCEHRGAILLFFIPLAMTRLALHPFYPQEHNWADFVVQMTFFVFHQPVIIILAYYAVQWPISLEVKLLFVVTGSFLVTLGIYEFLIRRIAWLSRLFGMKVTPRSERMVSPNSQFPAGNNCDEGGVGWLSVTAS